MSAREEDEIANSFMKAKGQITTQKFVEMSFVTS